MADDIQRTYKLLVESADAVKEIDRLNASLKKAEDELAKVGKSTDDTNKKLDGLGGAFSSLKDMAGKAFAALAAAQGIISLGRAIVETSDKIRTLEGSFKALLGSADLAADMLDRVYGIVKNTGAGMDDVSSAVQRLSIGMKEMGSTNQQIAQVAETFIKIGRVGGASMQDITGALQQFTQALASGKLQGDELRSILERMPLLAQVLAKEMGTAVGNLKDLGSQGKITADIMVNSLLKATEDVNKQFAELPLTFEQAMNKSNAELDRFLAALDESLSLSKTLAGVMQTLGLSIGEAADAMEQAKGQTNLMRDLVVGLGEVLKLVINIISDIFRVLGLVVTTFETLARIIDSVVSSSSNLNEVPKILNAWWESAVSTTRAMLGLAEATDKATESQRQLRIEKDRAAKEQQKQQDALQKDNYWLLKDGKDQADTWADLTNRTNEYNKKVKDAAEAAKKHHKGQKKVAEGAKEAKQELEGLGKVIVDLYKGAQERSAGLDQLMALMSLSPEALQALGVTTEQLAEATEKLKKQAGVWTMMDEAIKSVTDQQKQLDEYVATVTKLSYQLASGELDRPRFDALMKSLQKFNPQAEKSNEELDKTSTLLEDIGNKITGQVSTGLLNFIDNVGQAQQSFSDFATAFIKDITKMIVQLTIIEPLVKALKASFQEGGFFANLFSSSSAQGNAFAYPTGLPHGIYNQETYFPMLGKQLRSFAKGMTFGVGRLAEAGPEAIVPLQRNSSGDLGVGAAPVNVNVKVENNNGSDVKVQSSRDTNGDINLAVMVNEAVKKEFRTGGYDKMMKTNYGVQRRGF